MAKRSGTLAAIGLALGAAAGPYAQMHHVESVEKVTRAVGVYEWTGDLAKPKAARFVPVSLFIDGHFEDASLYLARPVPFALGDGYLYTVERSGEPQGVLDLQSAARVVSGNALADDNPAGAWYGFGTFTAQSPPPAAPALRQSAHVGVIQSSGAQPAPTATSDDADGKPHMSRRSPASTDGTTDTTTSSGQSSGQGKPGSTGGDDTDRPTLARRDPSKDAARRKPAVGGTKANTASVTAVGPQPGEDPDRPSLSRKTVAEEGPQQLTGMPADLHQAVAVSDAKNQETHPFARVWSDGGERAEVLAAMAALAKPRVSAYFTENKLLPSTVILATAAPASQSSEGVAADAGASSGAPPKLQRGKPAEYGAAPASTAATQSTQSTAAAKPAAPAPHHPSPASHRPASRTATRRPTHAGATSAASLLPQHEEISGFTLSYGGLPTFVYSASVPAASADPKGSAVTGSHLTVFVTAVAQRLPSGELQIALAAVTDSQHLDRGPQLKLVDAVDPDASHRANLLFELRETNGRQFALYRLITARAENTFTSATKE